MNDIENGILHYKLYNSALLTEFRIYSSRLANHIIGIIERKRDIKYTNPLNYWFSPNIGYVYLVISCMNIMINYI